MATPLSAETRRLNAEMKIPSAEVEKSRAPSLGVQYTFDYVSDLLMFEKLVFDSHVWFYVRVYYVLGRQGEGD